MVYTRTPSAPPPDLAPLAPRSLPDLTMLTAMQTGHGWFTYGSDATTNLNDTSDFLLGTQSAKLVSDGANGYAAMAGTFTSINAAGKQVLIWLKIPTGQAVPVAGITLDLASATDFSAKYQWAVLFNSDTAYQMSTGQWVCLTLLWAEATTTGSPNRAAIVGAQVAFQGSTTKQAVQFNGIAFIPEPTTAYPNGVISLTFDDSFGSTHSIAKQVMTPYGYTGTLFPTVGEVDTQGYALTSAQIMTLCDLGWEVGVHAMSVASHGVGWAAMSAPQLVGEITGIQKWIRNKGFRGGPVGAYPLGAFSQTAVDTVRPYLRGVRTTWPLPQESSQTREPFRIRAVTNVGGTGGSTVAQVLAMADKTKTSGGWLVLTIHELIASGTAGNNQMNRADFTTLIAGIASRAIPVRPMSAVL